MTKPDVTIAQVVGENVKKLRGRFTMEQVAEAGRSAGLSWSSGSIGSIEKGNFKPTLDTLIALAHVLPNIEHFLDPQKPGWNRDLPLSALIDSNQKMEITSTFRLDAESILDWASGNVDSISWDLTRQYKKDLEEHISQLRSTAISRSEIRIAKQAGIDPTALKVTSHLLWGKRFEEHRDELAGKFATPQKKGRISRELVAEIKAYLENKNGND